MYMDFSTLGINYVYALVTVIIGVVLALIVRAFVSWLKAKAGETDTHLDDIIIAAIGTPVQVAIVAISLYIASTYFRGNPPGVSVGPSNQIHYRILHFHRSLDYLHVPP